VGFVVPFFLYLVVARAGRSPDQATSVPIEESGIAVGSLGSTGQA
jgi:hypothetical protein